MKVRNAIFATLMATVFLAGCQGSSVSNLSPKAERVLPQKVIAKMTAKGMTRTSPIMVRIFKEEGALEIWKQKNNGRYDVIATYEICKWSGKLGPKFIEGDRQAPEGFYTVRPAQMNPNSQYYLAFNIGFPNAYDRANGRTGQNLMVHGACSSSGCYSMSDESVAEIYAFGRDAFKGGQRDFQIQAFPFRMTPANMARYHNDPNYDFWKMLKVGYDAFQVAKVPPKVDVCEKRYVFNNTAINGQELSPTAACPPMVQSEAMGTAYVSYQKTYEAAFSAAQGKSNNKSPAPSIAGLTEAKLVSAWSAARARGEKVTREPPSLTPASAEKPNAPDIRPTAHATAVALQTMPATVQTAVVQSATVPIPQAKPATPIANPVPSSTPSLVAVAHQNTAPVVGADTTVATTDNTTTGSVGPKKWWKVFGK